MRNSLRKLLKKLVIDNRFLFIEIEVNYPCLKIDYIVIGVQIYDEYYKLKYDMDRMVLTYDPCLDKKGKVIHFDGFLPNFNYLYRPTESIDESYYDILVGEVVNKLMNLNTLTYGFRTHSFIINKWL